MIADFDTRCHSIRRTSRQETCPELSIVTSLYRSAAYIEEFYRRAVGAAESVVRSFEIVMVNDGSPDDSLKIAQELAERDPRIVVVDLSRNFGHHMAFMAGIDCALGLRLFLIDVDLEESPEWLQRFTTEMDKTGADAVYGYQQKRSGNILERLSGQFFYLLFNLLSDTQIQPNLCTVRLLDRRYAEALRQLRDRNLYLAGNYAWAGFRQVGLSVEKVKRESRSNYGLVRSVRLLARSIVSFTAAPLRAIFLIGIVISMISGAFGCWILVEKLMDPSRVLMGWTSLMVSIWFLGGFLILIIGVIGIYLAAVFEETKARPPYLVRRVYSHSITTELDSGPP